MPPTETQENSAGPAIAIVIVLAVIILGGLYFWGQRDNADTLDSGSAALDERTEAITEQSSSDDFGSIEEDLEATELDDIGAELENL